MSELNRLEISAAPDEAELVAAVLALCVSHGWEEEDLPSGGTLFRVHSHNRQFCRELEAELKNRLPGLVFSLEQAPELDWLESWKEFFTPVRAGRLFIVLAPWMEKELAATKRIPIIIEPKTAFGTGHHASTALCLEALSDFFTEGKLRPGGGFLDLGTGSGILGIAAAKLGCRGLGVDPDLAAVENALENRALNRVEPEDFQIRRGSLEVVEDRPFDLVLANILAEPLLNMARPLLRRVGGCLILSGILLAQVEKIKEAYAGLGEPRLLKRDEWACLAWSG